jgi:2-polyprenyl-3-methyl-5-hydroxy-6-metoxy-1,4-benzoquinol methylase
MEMLKPESNYKFHEIKKLKNKLELYYNNTDYTPFDNPSDSSRQWLLVEKEILKNKNKIVRVLEVGSGKSGFYDWLVKRKLNKKVFLHSQDVTKKNISWLKKKSNDFTIGDLNKIKSLFDIIFSTYVLEHVVQPSVFLKKIYELTNANGVIFIFCPRYDILGYTNPSCRNFSLFTKVKIILCQLKYRILSLLLKKPFFLIQSDLAAFYKDYYIDCDAVHWVSKIDLYFWARNYNLEQTWFYLKSPARIFSKDWILKKYLTCAVKFKKY